SIPATAADAAAWKVFDALARRSAEARARAHIVRARQRSFRPSQKAVPALGGLPQNANPVLRRIREIWPRRRSRRAPRPPGLRRRAVPLIWDCRPPAARERSSRRRSPVERVA